MKYNILSNMKSYRKKSFEVIFYIFKITIIFVSTPVLCRNDIIVWDECTDLLVEVQKCSLKIHLPENCEDKTESELLLCSKAVIRKIHICEDPIAIRMIRNYFRTYKNSDKILCQKDIYSQFANNTLCTLVSKLIAVTVASAMTPGTLSDKGCRLLKGAMYINALSTVKYGCFEIVKEYIDALYAKTSCSHINTDAPSYNDLKKIREIFSHLVRCWIRHHSLPTCKTVFSKRMQCVNSVNYSGITKSLEPLVHNFINITKETDRVICGNQQLKQDFIDLDGCWTYVRTVGIMILRQANGLLTKDGCRAIQYSENMTMASFDQQCAKLLLDYRASMVKVLPCVEADPVSLSIAMSLHTSSITLLVVSMLYFISNICCNDSTY